LFCAGEDSSAVNEVRHRCSSTSKDEFPAHKKSGVVVLLKVPDTHRLTAASVRTSSTDDLGERAAELGAHCAVEDEVDGAVDDDRSIPDVAQGYVDVVEYTSINTTQERQKTQITFGKCFLSLQFTAKQTAACRRQDVGFVVVHRTPEDLAAAQPRRNREQRRLALRSCGYAHDLRWPWIHAVDHNTARPETREIACCCWLHSACRPDDDG